MWIPRTAYDALQAELVQLRAERGALERALATSQANVEWLRVMFNAASNDRAAIAAAKGFTLPAPQIEGQPQTPGAVVAAANTPTEIGNAFVEADDLDETMEHYTGSVNGFDDVGDEEASRLGIRHDGAGNVEYAKS